MAFYWYEIEYPDEGCCGPFDTWEQAEADALETCGEDVEWEVFEQDPAKVKEQ